MHSAGLQLKPYGFYLAPSPADVDNTATVLRKAMKTHLSKIFGARDCAVARETVATFRSFSSNETLGNSPVPVRTSAEVENDRVRPLPRQRQKTATEVT